MPRRASHAGVHDRGTMRLLRGRVPYVDDRAAFGILVRIGTIPHDTGGESNVIGHRVWVDIARIGAGGVPSHGAHVTESEMVKAKEKENDGDERGHSLYGFGVFLLEMKDVGER